MGAGKWMHARCLSQHIWREIQHTVGIESTDHSGLAAIVLNDSFRTEICEKKFD